MQLNFFAALLFSLVAIAPAGACPNIDGLLDKNCDQKLTIVTFGDSITFGRGDETGLGYPGRLNQLLPHATIYNFGVPGEKTPTGKVRAPTVFATVSNPDFLILLEGVNDFYLKTDRSFTNTRNNLQSMLFSGRNTKALTTLARLLDVNKTDQHFWVIGVNNAIAHLTALDFFKLGKSVLSFDRLHPNGAGYQRMAELVLIALQNQSANPANRPVDTDGDGVFDFAEVRAGIAPGAQDTDGDGLSDLEEITVYYSNPGSTDGDSDGLPDVYEVRTLGSNPANANPGAPVLINLEVVAD